MPAVTPHSVDIFRYQVFETDADLVEKELLFQSRSFDLAEMRCFVYGYQSEYKKDFMVYDLVTQDITASCFSDRTCDLLNRDRS